MDRSMQDTNEHDAVSALRTDTGSSGRTAGDGHSSVLRFALWALLVGVVPFIAIGAGLLGLACTGGSLLVTHCPWL